MAYCKECGAYIPDGQSKCLACGYDAAAEAARAGKKKRSGAAADSYAYQYDAQKDAEEQERRRQEQQARSRQWAEEEYARRKEERERQWSEEEYARQQAERERRSESYVNKGHKSRSSSASMNKGLAALSYLSILFVLPFIFCPEDRFARFHAKQGLALFVFGAIADVISSIFPVGWILTLFRIWCIFKGMSNANAGREEPLPYIGKYAMK